MTISDNDYLVRIRNSSDEEIKNLIVLARRERNGMIAKVLGVFVPVPAVFALATIVPSADESEAMGWVMWASALVAIVITLVCCLSLLRSVQTQAGLNPRTQAWLREQGIDPLGGSARAHLNLIPKARIREVKRRKS